MHEIIETSGSYRVEVIRTFDSWGYLFLAIETDQDRCSIMLSPDNARAVAEALLRVADSITPDQSKTD